MSCPGAFERHLVQARLFSALVCSIWCLAPRQKLLRAVSFRHARSRLINAAAQQALAADRLRRARSELFWHAVSAQLLSRSLWAAAEAQGVGRELIDHNAHFSPF